jgi:hypothetical protein
MPVKGEGLTAFYPKAQNVKNLVCQFDAKLFLESALIKKVWISCRFNIKTL